MRLLSLVLLVLLVLIQYPLWLGKGGWFTVWDSQKQIAAQHEANEGLRARSELGMMREGEVFVQIVPPGNVAATTAAPTAATTSRPAAASATSNRPAPNAAPANPPRR